MKYTIRAIKYFFYFAIITTLIITALVLIGAVESDINAIFEGGYTALWKIALFYAAIAAVYPKVGFINRKVEVNREWGEIREETISFFADRRYEVESESDGKITFRVKGTHGKLAKMFEDRVTVTRVFDGYEFEGLRKDILRLSTGFETRFQTSNEA